MLIDWFTVGAQLINFVVLLWLMKRFLYKPILTAISAREKRIADEVAGAAREKAGAELLRRDLQAKSQAFDAERAAVIARAVADAGAEHDRLLAQWRTAADATRLTWQVQWQKDRTAQSATLNRMVTDEVFAIARQALRDLSGVGLEDRMVVTLLTRLRDMSPNSLGPWIAALKAAAPAVVRSRFALAASSRALIQAALDDRCASPVPLRFDTPATDVDGIELLAAGQRVAWTITDYLQSLKTQVEALGREPTTPVSASDAAAEPVLALAAAS